MTSQEHGRPSVLGSTISKSTPLTSAFPREGLLDPGASLEAVSANGIVAWFKLGLGLDHGQGMAIYATFN